MYVFILILCCMCRVTVANVYIDGCWSETPDANIVDCQSETPGCSSLLGGQNIYICEWQNISAPVTISLTLSHEAEFFGMTFFIVGCNSQAIKEIRIDFGDGSSYETSLRARLYPSLHILWEAISFPRVKTSSLNISVLSSYNNLEFGLSGIDIIAYYFAITETREGAQCEATHPGCERTIDNNGSPFFDSQWAFTGEAVGTEINVWSLHPYTVYEVWIGQLYDLRLNISVCHFRDLQFTFDDGSQQQITLPECEWVGDEGTANYRFDLDPVTTQRVNTTVLSTYNTSHTDYKGLSRFDFYAGEPLAKTPPPITTMSSPPNIIPSLPTTTQSPPILTTSSPTMTPSLPTLKPSPPTTISLPISTGHTTMSFPQSNAATTVNSSATGTSDLPGWIWPVVAIVIAVIFSVTIIASIIILLKRRSRQSDKPSTEETNSVYNEITEYIPAVHNPYNEITEYIPSVPKRPDNSGVAAASKLMLHDKIQKVDQQNGTDAGNTTATIDVEIEDSYLKMVSSEIAIDAGHTNKSFDVNQNDDTYLKPITATRDVQASHFGNNRNEYLEMLAVKAEYGNDDVKSEILRNDGEYQKLSKDGTYQALTK